jgi:prevent-host-death family protein
MTEVGVRELRNGLSRWLERVKQGDEVLITERGRPVARLTRVDTRSGLDELVARGLVTPARYRPSDLPLPPRLEVPGGVSDLVSDQRG